MAESQNDGKFGVILADPPWWYQNRNPNHKTKFGGGARGHYPLMTDEEILGMGDFVRQLSANDSVLFLWATGPRMDLATDVVAAWGFRYCTIGFVWEKVTKRGDPHMGPGFYTASNAEFLLVGALGKNRPEKAMLPQIVRHPRLKHSEKPEVFRQKIELMYPGRRKIELFSRHGSPGWEAWGNETGTLVGTASPRLVFG